MKISDLPKDKPVLVRWRDIVHLKDGLRPEDSDAFDTIVPILEFIGKFIKAKRSIMAFEMEWEVTNHNQYEFIEAEGTAGHETQLVPIGCLESIHEVNIGKCLYQRGKGAVKKTNGIPADSNKS